MQECVVYARVSTKEQQSEGYSIPAQVKAIRAFCVAQSLSPVAEFIEAESAGKAGRTEFGKMCAFLTEHPSVKVVVAHKLDRLYRNFRDQITLEEDLGVRPRYVLADIPDTPQGELLRDVNLSVSKFYLANLREEVIKGMDEKVAQGGWPHRAPVGYLNDKNTRTLVVDEEAASFVRLAFQRYATGQVSLAFLADELYALGFRSRTGKKMTANALHQMLKHPIYLGLIRYKGRIYPGAHEPMVSQELFDAVQAAFEPNRNGVKSVSHVFALRDWLYCAECGCKITAERQKGFVYYRCTHGKGREKCSQRTYTREELLMEQVSSILASIEIPDDVLRALVEDCKALDQEEAEKGAGDRSRLELSLQKLKAKASKLLDSYLDGVVSVEDYQAKSSQIETERQALERALASLSVGSPEKTSQVEALLATAQGARLAFEDASVEGKREVLSTVLLNADIRDGSIASYQLKRPFGALQMDSSGAFCQSWWAMRDLNPRLPPCKGGTLPLS